MKNKDIRWIQRFSNFKRAFEQLKNAVESIQKRKLSNLEKQGLIQAFEYTHELSWKVFKDFLAFFSIKRKSRNLWFKRCCKRSF